MEKTILRTLRLSDVNAVTALERVCNPMPWNEGDLTPFAADFDSGNSTSKSIGLAAILENSGQVVGYVCAQSVVDEAEILVLGVAPEYRGQGFGQSLLTELISVLKAGGCASLFLEVRFNNQAAVSLYQKMGFVQTGIRKGYYADNGEDARLLQFNITPP